MSFSLSPSLILTILSAFLVVSCGGGSSGGGSDDYSFNCDNTADYDYSSKYTHTVNHTAATKSGTVIFAHGKTGWPYSPTYYDGFFSDLATAGFDVNSVQMPWALNSWDGSSCQALNLLQDKAAEFKSNGEKLIIIGHSMGGSHVEILAAMDSTLDIDGIVALAPGHMPHLSTRFQTTVAAEVSTARSLVQNNQGSLIGTYQTPNGGITESISISAENFLSYHDIAIFADHRQMYPRTHIPSLWIGGNSDPLVSIYQYQVNFNLLGNPAGKNQFALVDGDHLGMIENSGSTVINWINSL